MPGRNGAAGVNETSALEFGVQWARHKSTKETQVMFPNVEGNKYHAEKDGDVHT